MLLQEIRKRDVRQRTTCRIQIFVGCFWIFKGISACRDASRHKMNAGVTRFTGAGLTADEDDLPLCKLRARLKESTGERALDSDAEQSYFPFSSLGLLQAPLASANLRALVSRMESGSKRLRSEVL